MKARRWRRPTARSARPNSICSTARASSLITAVSMTARPATAARSPATILPPPSRPPSPASLTRASRTRRWAAPSSGDRALLRADHHQPVGAGFRAPDFAGPAEQLPHLGVGAVAGKALEAFGLRIEAHDGIGAEIGQPHLVLVIDIDGIGFRPLARQAPAAPGVRRRIV